LFEMIRNKARTSTRLFAARLAARLGQFGIDPFCDIYTRGIQFSPKTIFDVGANHGHVSARFAKKYPTAMIYAFEPSRRNLRGIQRTTESHTNVCIVPVALSARVGTANFVDDDRDHTMSRIESAPCPSQGSYEINTQTLDEFCREQSVTNIDYLKIDTEGHDHEVLAGATSMLRNAHVAFVEVEAGINPDNHFHAPFEAMKSDLESLDYRLFGVYEQVHEWPTQRPHLRRVNAVFIPITIGNSIGNPS
jgi:FkbM family methyltransferase